MSVVGDRPVVASWSDTGKVFLYDVSHPLQAVNDPALLKTYIDSKQSPRPLFVFKGQWTVFYSPFASIIHLFNLPYFYILLSSFCYY